MMGKLFKYYLLFIIATIILISCSSISNAAPYTGEVFSFKQPDNTFVDVKIWGDEYYQRAEGLDGYTLCYDRSTNWICYAELDSTGTDFVSTGIKYNGKLGLRGTAFKSRNLKKGLKLKRESVFKKVSEKQKTLFLGGTPGYLNSYPVGNTPVNQYTVSEGNVKGLTILVDFYDCRKSFEVDEISDMLNLEGYSGYNNNGSVRDYFYDVSAGKLSFTNDVIGYYTARYPKTYYNANVAGRPQELVKEALDYAMRRGYDFSKLTVNPGNEALAVSILYAGEPDVEWGKGLWPQNGSISDFNCNGVYVKGYQLSPIRSKPSIGAFVHEACHMICGYPDLYDVNFKSKGVGEYCIMGSTSSNNPQPPNPFLRCHVSGWGKMASLNMYPFNSRITVNSNNLDVYSYSSLFSRDTEFFLIESVCKEGRWASMPDEGLLIWHIDTRGKNDRPDMTAENHYEVSVEQADGQYHLENNDNFGGDGDLFHAGYADAFGTSTNPDSRLWDGRASGLNISDISGIGPYMTFIYNRIGGHTITPIPSETQTPTATPTVTPSSTQTPTPIPLSFKISGHIRPDMGSPWPDLFSGFKVELWYHEGYTFTNSSGYYEIPDIKEINRIYTVKISKPYYLTRTIGYLNLSDDISIGSVTSPIEMWAGDLNQDGAINMSDVVMCAACFNSKSGDERYNAACDVNMDMSISMKDIVIIAKHFNRTAEDYR